MSYVMGLSSRIYVWLILYLINSNMSCSYVFYSLYILEVVYFSVKSDIWICAERCTCRNELEWCSRFC